jgi:membrane protein YdbS with pleckstrin-like domain
VYEALKGPLLALLKAPSSPPEPPFGSPESVQVFRASRKFLLFRLVVLGAVFFPLVLGLDIAALLVTMDERATAGLKVLLWFVALLALLGGLLGYFITRLEYDMRYYIITDRSLRIREGILLIREVTLTYANVQHLEIRQGPIQQMLGISDLIVRTAGGGASVPKSPDQSAGHEGVFRGIENAEQVRDQINALLKRYRDSGLGDPEDRRKEAGAFSPRAAQVLREIRDELRARRRPS